MIESDQDYILNVIARDWKERKILLLHIEKKLKISFIMYPYFRTGTALISIKNLKKRIEESHLKLI